MSIGVVKGQSTNPWLNNSGDDVYLVSEPNGHAGGWSTSSRHGSASTHVDEVWACVPDGSLNFDWRAQSLCASNGGSGNSTIPDAVSDLAAEPGEFPGEVLLTWTATGDDGSVGTAAEYVIKVSDAAITDETFAAAIDLDFWINEPLPG